MLLYRLHRGSASLIRIIFYGWIVLAVVNVPISVTLVQQDINQLPTELSAYIGIIGLAVGLWHWTAPLARTPDIGKANDQHPAETTVFVAEEASTKNWWGIQFLTRTTYKATGVNCEQGNVRPTA